MKNLFTALVQRKTKTIEFPYLSSFNKEKVNASLLSNYKNQKKKISKLKKMSLTYWLITFPLLAIFLISTHFISKNFLYISNNEDFEYFYTFIPLIIFIILLYVFSCFIKKMRKKLIKGKDLTAEAELLKNYEKNLTYYVAENSECFKCDLFCISRRLKSNGEAGALKHSKNVEVFVFKRNEDLCILIEDTVFYIPVSRIENFYIYKKAYFFANWNKEDPFNSTKYKPYKIGYETTSYQYFVKNCSHLILNTEGQEYEIIFPPYETPIIEKITGIKAELPPEREEK